MKASRKYRIKKRRVVFSKGPIHLVDCDVVMRGGEKLSRQIIEHPGSVVIIPRLSKTKFLLVKQFRFAAKNWLWEFPAGGVEAKETLRQAAKRELREETGFGARKLTKLIHFYPSPGVSGEVMHLYLAEDLYPSALQPDDDEDLELRSFSLARLRDMIKRGLVVDAKTILTVYLLHKKGIK